LIQKFMNAVTILEWNFQDHIDNFRLIGWG